jgi:CDGSH-type Zn-finger protein
VGQSGPGSTSEAGELTIKAATDGPLLTRGKLTIFASTGRVAWEGEKTALCRCGASQNKPFCDGSHNAVRRKTNHFAMAATKRRGLRPGNNQKGAPKRGRIQLFFDHLASRKKISKIYTFILLTT